MDGDEWKKLKQAAIRFELKTGLDVNVTASRQNRTVFQFSSDRKGPSDTRSIAAHNRGVSSGDVGAPMSYAGFRGERERSPQGRQVQRNDDPLDDFNDNSDHEDIIDYGHDNDDDDDLDLGESTFKTSAISIKAKIPKKQTRGAFDEVACSAPIKMRNSYVPRPITESPVSESYYGSKMHSNHLNNAAQY